MSVIARDATQDTVAANAAATTLAAVFPSGACAAGRLIVSVAQLPTTRSNVTVKGGVAFTEQKFQDDFATATLIGSAKISDGTETGVTWTHTAVAGQMRVFGFQYTGAASTLVGDASGATADDGTPHGSVAIVASGATTQPDELVISAAGLLGVANTPISSNGVIIGNSGNSVYVAERIVSVMGTFNDTISWSGGGFFCVGILFTIKAALDSLLVDSGFWGV